MRAPHPLPSALSLLLAFGGISFATPALAGETAPTCVRPGQCFVTGNLFNGPITGNLYTTSARGQLFGIDRRRVSYCRMVSSIHRNDGNVRFGKRVRYGEVNCLSALREGNPFYMFPVDNSLVNATCDNPTRLRSRLTLVIDGRRYTGDIATAVARPCVDT